MSYPFSRELLFSFDRFRELLGIIVLFPLNFVLCNHFHTFNSDLWLLSTTTPSTLLNWLIQLLTLGLNFIATFAFSFVLTSIQDLFESVFWVSDLLRLLKLLILLEKLQMNKQCNMQQHILITMET